MTGFPLIYPDLGIRVDERKPGIIAGHEKKRKLWSNRTHVPCSSCSSERQRVKPCRLLADGETNPHKPIEDMGEASAILAIAKRI